MFARSARDNMHVACILPPVFATPSAIVMSARFSPLMSVPESLLAIFCAAVLTVPFSGCGQERRGPNAVDPDAPTEFTATDSGLKYRILRRGTGEFPTPTSRVTVDYRGWLENGRTFDQSYGSREPVSFKLSGVVPGWTEGMQLVREGGMIELIIPSNLAYGEKGNQSIPPNSTLNFRVELHEVE